MQSGKAAPANRWFAERRDFHVRSFYSGCHAAYTAFTALQQEAHQGAKIDPAGEMAALLGALRQLRQQCRLLFKESSEPDGLELEWVMTALFHEAVKLQENVTLDRDNSPARPAAGRGHERLSRELFMEGIVAEIPGQMANLTILFDQANSLLRLLLPGQAHNTLLLRLLLEEGALSEDLWGVSATQIFAELFPDQPEAAYLLAAKSYFNGQWLSDSLAAYETALALNPDLEEARRRTFLIRAMIRDGRKFMAT
ncbi:MAG: hypothetical protein RI601_10525 [Desulfurivibrionaceae bacterium]|nr:hypothetical protein [Desulfurivibrionaceae bacterium]